jgi:DNA-binding transcriptional regulator YdaS (Cro superfamily)
MDRKSTDALSIDTQPFRCAKHNLLVVSWRMDLHAYILSMLQEDRPGFAERCGTSLPYLMQIAYGNRKPKAALAIAIERESGGEVRCEQLLPDIDWDYLRSTAARDQVA